MGVCTITLSRAVLGSRRSPTVCSAAGLRAGSKICRDKPRLVTGPRHADLIFCNTRRRSTEVQRQKQKSAAAWAGEFQTAASSYDLKDQNEGNSKFRHLCHSQLKLVSTVLQKADGGYGTRLTVYRREASSFEAGQLQLSKISTFTDPGVQSSPPDLDGTLFLGVAGACASSRGAERALTQAQLVDLPNTGAFVLPLAAHSFLVGLLVIEQVALAPHLPSANPKLAIQPLQWDQTAAAASGGTAQQVMLSGKDREVVQLAGQVLASACAMDLHSALDRLQSAMRSQQVLGLVEEARGPLTALRTLGSILVPRLRQREGQEVDRDVAQGIMTQGDRLQEVVSQLQAAIHPIALPSACDIPGQADLPALPKASVQPHSNIKATQTLLPSRKQDSSADDQLQA